MISYPGTPGTIELLGMKDSVKMIGREYNTLTRYYRYHLSRPAEKSRYYLSDLFQKEVDYYVQFCDKNLKKKEKPHEPNKEAWIRNIETIMMKQPGEKMASWILKPQLLCAVILRLPLVSCASTVIPFLRLLSSSAVLDVNFYERVREIKKDNLGLRRERETRARLLNVHTAAKKSLDIPVTRNVMVFNYCLN